MQLLDHDIEQGFLPLLSWQHGRYEQVADTAAPPSRLQPPSVFLHVPQWASVLATFQSAACKENGKSNSIMIVKNDKLHH